MLLAMFAHATVAENEEEAQASGFPGEETMRTCLFAMHFAQRIGPLPLDRTIIIVIIIVVDGRHTIDRQGRSGTPLSKGAHSCPSRPSQATGAQSTRPTTFCW